MMGFLLQNLAMGACGGFYPSKLEKSHLIGNSKKSVKVITKSSGDLPDPTNLSQIWRELPI